MSVFPYIPATWRERTPEEYLKLLDEAVRWSTELNMIVIIDWHSYDYDVTKSGEFFKKAMYGDK